MKIRYICPSLLFPNINTPLVVTTPLWTPPVWNHSLCGHNIPAERSKTGPLIFLTSPGIFASPFPRPEILIYVVITNPVVLILHIEDLIVA